MRFSYCKRCGDVAQPGFEANNRSCPNPGGMAREHAWLECDAPPNTMFPVGAAAFGQAVVSAVPSAMRAEQIGDEIHILTPTSSKPMVLRQHLFERRAR